MAKMTVKASIQVDCKSARHSRSQVGRLPAWVSQMESFSFADELFTESQQCSRRYWWKFPQSYHAINGWEFCFTSSIEMTICTEAGWNMSAVNISLFISNFPLLGKDTMCLSRRNLRLEKVVEVLVLLPNPLRGTRQFEKECSAQLSSLYETVH